MSKEININLKTNTIEEKLADDNYASMEAVLNEENRPYEVIKVKRLIDEAAEKENKKH